MTVLVTGANGMIGSQLVKELLEKGYHVIGIDRTEDEREIENYYYYKIDLGEKKKLQTIVNTHKVDRFIHLAGLAHTEGELDCSWNRYYHVNVECSKNFFEVASNRPVLFISTIDVYGFFDGKRAVNNKSELNPVSKYGKSKALAEQECQKLNNFDIFRFSPVYTNKVKRDIQKRYYFKYPYVAYLIGKGSEYEILNVNEAVRVMVDWCTKDTTGTVRIIKDEKLMWTPDYIRYEKKAGRAKLVVRLPRWLVNCIYKILIKLIGENEKTFLLNKAVHPLKTI